MIKRAVHEAEIDFGPEEREHQLVPQTSTDQ